MHHMHSAEKTLGDFNIPVITSTQPNLVCWLSDTDFMRIIRITALALCESKSRRQGRLEDKEAGNNYQIDVVRTLPLQLMLPRSSIQAPSLL